MRYRRLILFLFCLNVVFVSIAQQDSVTLQQKLTIDNIQNDDTEDNDINSSIEEIIVTATKGETNINKTTVPVQQIIKKYLKASGTVKLSQILQEQTGIQLTNFLGAGVQLQGLSAEYTLILINGEPIIGKNAGVVDLSRIIISNIKKVEIIKGPVSCLYGSDAIGGVINVITEDFGVIQKSSLDYTFQYKTPVQIANNLSGVWAKNKLTIENNVNHNFSNGYHTVKETIYKENAPYQDFTLNNKITYRATKNIHFGSGLKYYYSKLHNIDDWESGSVKQLDKLNEVNINPFFKYISNKNIVLNVRSYNSYYKYNSHFEGKKVDNELYDDNYSQLFNKLEAQLDYKKKGHLFTAGAGGFYNLVNTKRNVGKITQHQEFVFLQYQYEANDKFIINLGNRIDVPNDYKTQWFSPKLSARYNVNKYFYIKASGGRGYRAPEIRQQYLNFTNNLVGYSVFGTNVAIEQLDLLHSQGAITYNIDRNKLKELKPESSWAFNGEIGFNPIPNKLSLSANYFRNEISNLIESSVIATKTQNGALIYSYFNLKKIFTQGLETEFSYNILKGLTLSGGYQFLVAVDREVLDRVKAGNVIRKNPITNEDERISKNEYYGLFNRSKHSFNVKIFYENTKHDFNTYIRVIYRGKYGLADQNGNKILDLESEFVPGQTFVNLSFTKNISKKFSVMFGMENFIQKKTSIYVPNINKITAYIGLSVNLLNK